MEKERKEGYVPFGKLLAWQTRPIAMGAITIIIAYLSMFCTDMLHMSPIMVGTVLMASKIFDGVTDLFAGWLVDNTKTKFGKGRPYEFCVIGAWACMYALFATNIAWSTTAKCIWLFIMYALIFSVFQTLLNASETPYIIRSFGDRIAITKVSAYGGIFVTLGCMVVSVTFPLVVQAMGDSITGWKKIMAMYAIPLTLLGMIRFFVVKEDFAPEDEDESDPVTIKSILQVLAHNKYIWLLGIATMVPQAITGMAAATYYFKNVVGDLGLYSVIQMAGMVSLLCMLIFPTLMKRYSGMHLVGVFSFISLIGYVMLFFAGKNMVILLIASIISGVASLPTSYMRAPIIMQIADYNEKKGLSRMEGTLGSAINFIVKIGQALGSFLFLALIGAAGYDGSLAVQPESAQLMIRIGYSIVPAILMAVVIWTSIAFRPLDKMTGEAK